MATDEAIKKKSKALAKASFAIPSDETIKQQPTITVPSDDAVKITTRSGHWVWVEPGERQAFEEFDSVLRPDCESVVYVQRVAWLWFKLGWAKRGED